MNKNCYITLSNCVTPLGFDVKSNFEAISNGISGIQFHEKSQLLNASFHAATIDSESLNNAFLQIETDDSFSRLEKMLILALKPIIEVEKISHRTAFILSTTKGNITTLENSAPNIQQAQLGTLAKKMATYFGFTTEPIVVSNACVSGVLAIAVAKRLIQAGAYDDAYIVAGDEVSSFVLSGFNSFQAMSDKPCMPFDKNRDGVTLGEASAAVYITSHEIENCSGVLKVLGDGSVNDANHISGPSRTGEGLVKSIESALKESGVAIDSIDYISAHGTATLYNDEMEAIAFNRLGLDQVPVNSFKGFFGHTLGASGLLEAVIAAYSASENHLIASKGYTERGTSYAINIIKENKAKSINYFLKTASGFGGCNTAVIFEKIN